MPPGWTAALRARLQLLASGIFEGSLLKPKLIVVTTKRPASTKLTTIARGENERSEVVNTYGCAGFVEVESMYASTIDWDVLQWTADVIAT